jgi:hypothetical protein
MRDLFIRANIGLAIFLLCLYTVDINAQQEIPIGQWGSYLPFNAANWVAQSPDKIYYASDIGLLALNKSDISAEFFTKVEGLSDVRIKLLNYDEGTETLVLGYENSNIDLISPDGIENLNNILRNSQIIGEKTIHQIRFDGVGNAYLCTAFGLVQIDLETKTFGFTTFIDFDVWDMVEYEGRFYISTFDGIYTAPSSPTFNHGDFASWERIDDMPGLPSMYTSQAICAKFGSIWADIDGSLYRIRNDEAQLVREADNFEVQYFSPEGEVLVIGMFCNGEGGCTRDKLLFMNESNNFVESERFCVDRSNYAIQDEEGRIFYANQGRNFVYSEFPGQFCIENTFNTPITASASEIYIDNNVVYVASGGVNNDLNYTFNSAGLQIYEDGLWSARNRETDEIFEDPVMLDFYRVLVHPFTKDIFVGTFWGGLIIFPGDGGEISILNEDNSCIAKYPEEGLRERVAGLAFDRNYDLWLTANRAPEPLVHIDSDGNCHSFRTGNIRDLTQLAVDDNDFKWIVVFGNSAGLVVYDEGDLEDPSDDRLQIKTSGNSELPTNLVNCVEKDLDGDIWVGTDEGVVVFDCTGSVFTNGCDGTRRKVDEDGNIAFLLEDEIVQTIAVDGANRKWFGTTNGIFVQSPSGEESVYRFNTANAPLPSNDIRDIHINPETGEVFIATAEGIMSYRTDATEGGDIHDDKVIAYPNPVHPDYDGPIAIKGLARDATVKITDIRGRLIFQTRANGGQAIWDGRDYNGRKAATGVYLVFSSSQESFNKPDAAVTKILFIQ